MAVRKVNKIQKFIKDNSLTFDGFGSDINSNLCALSGYACYLELDLDELKGYLKEGQIEDEAELEKVFNFAESHNYGNWWKSDEAKAEYKF